MRRSVPLTLSLPFVLAAWTVRAQETDPVADPAVPEGHSNHGEAFNEGPRQAAYLMPGMNAAVHFAVSTENESAQAFFNQGIVQLHGFWYFEAERSFRQVAAIDPDCAMAYWGMAMANTDNQERAHGFAREAWLRRDGVDDRERRWIEATARFYGADFEEPKAEGGDAKATKDKDDDKDANAWTPPKGRSDADKKRRQRFIEDIEALLGEHPDDIESKALLANQMWIDQRSGRRILSQQANQALLDQVFAKVPLHPAHHYAIHLWDKKKTGYRARQSAQLIGYSAPGIAHMWHMSGHIWARLDRHADAAFMQEASARVDHAHMMRDGVMPDQIHNYAHNNEWLCRSLRHVGRVRDSIDLGKNMVELPRHPSFNMPGEGYNSSSYGRRRLVETLLTFECWDEIDALLDTMYLAPAAGDDEDELVRQRAQNAFLAGRSRLARAGAAPDAATAQLAALDTLVDEARALRARAIDDAEDEAIEADKSNGDVDKAIESASKTATRLVRDVRRYRDSLRGLEQCASGEIAAGIEQLKKADYDRSEHGGAHLSRLYLAIDKNEDAEKAARKAAKEKGRVQPLANLVHVLAAAGKADEAKEVFAELRKLADRSDLDYPPFARLAEFAAAHGFDRDWREPYVPPADVGDRPELDTLGTFRWAPVAAAGDWKLKNGFGVEKSLADWSGRPTLVVFFLGFGCVHCVEQLQALRPHVAAFREAGVDVVAIGTDSIAQIAEADRNAGQESRYPFSILANPELDVFKQYRCYDDFEDMALHGTFLLDGNGFVRWQDISYEPFMEIEFLLGEAKRLLALPVSSTAAAVPGDAPAEAKHGER